MLICHRTTAQSKSKFPPNHVGEHERSGVSVNPGFGFALIRDGGKCSVCERVAR